MAFFRPLVLVYHAVSDDWNDPLSVRVADFEQQMRTLVARGYRGGTWRDLLSDSGNRKLVHITFDDAFRSVANALPVLRDLRLPSTIFACARYADDGGRLSIPQLASRSDDGEISTMDWTALRQIVEDGPVEIGSHGLGHVDLVQLSRSKTTSAALARRSPIRSEARMPGFAGRLRRPAMPPRSERPESRATSIPFGSLAPASGGTSRPGARR